MRKWLCLILLSLLLTGCDAENWNYRLPYAGPVEMSIPMGETIPGTGIQFLDTTPDGARVSIDGKETLRKIGDSLDWRDEILDGVSVDQTYRVAFIAEDSLQLVGTVRLIIPNPQPQAEEPNRSAKMHFKLPVGYHVEKDTPIPATDITYLGQTEQGARLGNVEGYEYRKIGDSIVWEGKLREGIWIELNLRTALITDDTLDVAGTVDLWLQP
jgi:hypothetical protein